MVWRFGVAGRGLGVVALMGLEDWGLSLWFRVEALGRRVHQDCLQSGAHDKRDDNRTKQEL